MKAFSLALFANAPILGQTKTRLQGALGSEGALAAHCELVEYALTQLSAVMKKSSIQVELWVSADHPVAQQWARTFGVPINVQCGDDLGARMHHALVDQLSRGAEFAMLMGCDCPLLDGAYVSRLMQCAADADVVIAPAEDGGYGLIGVSSPQPQLFAEMPWGSSVVFAETLLRCRDSNLRVAVGEQIWDVDRPDDWARFQSFRRRQQGG